MFQHWFHCMLLSRHAGNFFLQPLILVPLFPESYIFLFLNFLHFFFFLLDSIIEYIPKNGCIVFFYFEFVQAYFLVGKSLYSTSQLFSTLVLYANLRWKLFSFQILMALLSRTVKGQVLHSLQGSSWLSVSPGQHITHSSGRSQNISWFCTYSPNPSSHSGHKEDRKTPAHTGNGCATREEPWA